MTGNQNHLLERLDDTNPVHQALMESSRDALTEVLKDFVFTDCQIETLPTQKRGVPFVHNSFFYMSANKMNALVCISMSPEALQNSVKRILGESTVTEADAVDAAQELANILYGLIKKRLQHYGFSFGLANYQYAKMKPLTPLLTEEVRYGFEFFIGSDLGPLCAKILYDTISINLPKGEERQSTVNSTYLKGYQAVKLGEFSSDKKIDFDIFIHLRLNNKILMYKRGGDFISEDILKRFKTHRIETFYIRDEDQSKFIDYIATKAASVVKNEDLAIREKQEVIEAVAKNLISGMFDDPDNSDAYLKTAHEVVNRFVDEILTAEDPLKKIFNRLETQLQSMETHACNVQALSTVMAMILGYTTEKALISVALGALFHDIGYSKIPKELHSSDESQLSVQELEIVKQHPMLGVDIISQSATDFPYESKLIIQQHHERHDGSGYPLGIKGFQTYELSKVVALANEFENRLQRSPTVSREDIIRSWWSDLNQDGPKKFDPVVFKRIFGKLVPAAFS